MDGNMVYPGEKRKVSDSWSGQAKTNSIILLAFAIFMGWLMAKDVSQSLTSGNWQATQAFIVVSKINRGSRGGPDSPWIEYQYVVDNRNYVSDRIDFGGWSYGDVPSYISNFPVGFVTTAYYDPDHPEEAVLDKSGSHSSSLLLCIVAWIGAALIVYYRFFKLEKDN
jgi:hypothetical protein